MGSNAITGHVFIATSLDGYLARDDGDITWLLERDDLAEDHDYVAIIEKIEVIVMGRRSFERMQAMRPWPSTRPVVVPSFSLAQVNLPEALAGTARVCDAAPEEAMWMLLADGKRRAYVDGGLVVQSFLRAGLSPDMVITRVPVLLGGCRSLFGDIAADIPVFHEETRSFPSWLAQSRYRVVA